MSAALMGRATWLQTVTCPEKMVLVAILDVADDHGLAYLLIETLMAKSSLSRRGVQNAITSLVEKRIMKRRIRRNRSSIFLVDVKVLPVGRPDELNDRELSDDHRWDDDEGGAGGAPQAKRENARRAPGGAGGAPGGAGGAPIHPVLHPVIHPVLSPIVPKEENDLFGEPVDTTMTEDAIAEMWTAKWNALRERAPKLEAIEKPLAKSVRKSLLARIDEHAPKRTEESVGAWIDALFDQVASSRWLRGDNDRGYVVTHPWLLGPKNYGKVEGGFYARDAGSAPQSGYDVGRSRTAQASAAARNAMHARGGSAGTALRRNF